MSNSAAPAGQITMDSVMLDAIDWTADRLATGQKITAATAWRYVDRNYPGGWDAFERDMTRTVRL